MSGFQEVLDKHINDLRSLQTQINELKEFQKQWSDLFDMAEKQMGEFLLID